MKVELIYDLSCPNVPATRANLLRSFSDLGITATWQEWDRNSVEAPDYVKSYGSPTLLVNGKDLIVMPSEAAGDCCRIYPTGGVPSTELIIRAFKNHGDDGKKAGVFGILASGPGVGAAFLAKAACPFCYPAIAGFLSSVGLGFLFNDRPLLILTAFALLVVLFGLWFKATSRRGYRPFFLGLVAVAAGTFSKFFENEVLFYFATSALIFASIWNLIPVRSCGACVSTEAINPIGAKGE